MKAHSCLAFLLLIVAVAKSGAADGDWLWSYPFDGEHRIYRGLLDQLAAQPLFLSESNLAGTPFIESNFVESYRYLNLSSWGFHSAIFSFTKTPAGKSTNKTAVVCHFERKDWEGGGTNDIAVFRCELTTEASGKLLQKLSGHAIYSKPESLKYKTPDPPRTFTTDAGDIIIERWTGTSYSRIMRPGVFDSYHEEVVKDFVKLCYESRDEIKKEMPEKK